MKINIFFLVRIHIWLYTYIYLDSCFLKPKLTKRQMLFTIIWGVVMDWSNKNMEAAEKKGWRNMVDRRGRPKASFLFFFLKKRKDGFLWKNTWLSGDTEILPYRGLIFPKTIYNGCTWILPFPYYISFDLLILRANTEKCIINILLSNTLSKSDPINLFCTENYLPQTNNTASY